MNQIYLLHLLLLVTVMSSSAKIEWKPDYHKQSESQFQVGKKAFEDIPLKGNERILDVGCGTGRTTNYFAQKLLNASILGIDISSDMIDFAKKEFADTPNLSFEVHDATQLPFKEAFDVVISFYCLHWIDEKQQALQQIANVLKPGGKAYLYLSYAAELYVIWRECIDEVAKEHPEWAPHIGDEGRMRSFDVWAAFARNAGFEIDNHSMFEKVSVYPTMEDFKKHAMVLGIADLPDDEKSKFVDAVLKKFYKRLGLKANEPFHFNPTTLVLELTKK